MSALRVNWNERGDSVHHMSRFSLRRPHCGSLREESNSRTTCRLSAVNMPMRACISGPRSSAAINSASIAACHSSDCRVLPVGKAMMYLAASLSVRSVLPRPMVSDPRMHETRALFQRFSQPLHDELDIPGLKLSPAFDFGLISILWVFFEIRFGQLSRE